MLQAHTMPLFKLPNVMIHGSSLTRFASPHPNQNKILYGMKPQEQAWNRKGSRCLYFIVRLAGAVTKYKHWKARIWALPVFCWSQRGHLMHSPHAPRCSFMARQLLMDGRFLKRISGLGDLVCCNVVLWPEAETVGAVSGGIIL